MEKITKTKSTPTINALVRYLSNTRKQKLYTLDISIPKIWSELGGTEFRNPKLLHMSFMGCMKQHIGTSIQIPEEYRSLFGGTETVAIPNFNEIQDMTTKMNREGRREYTHSGTLKILLFILGIQNGVIQFKEDTPKATDTISKINGGVSHALMVRPRKVRIDNAHYL